MIGKNEPNFLKNAIFFITKNLRDQKRSFYDGIEGFGKKCTQPGCFGYILADFGRLK